MRYARQLLRAAQDVSIPTGNAIPAPKYWEPASKAPSPVIHLVIGCGVGLVFAGYYKMAYWAWKKEVNQFYYDYNKVMAEEGPAAREPVAAEPAAAAPTAAAPAAATE